MSKGIIKNFPKKKTPHQVSLVSSSKNLRNNTKLYQKIEGGTTISPPSVMKLVYMFYKANLT